MNIKKQSTPSLFQVVLCLSGGNSSFSEISNSHILGKTHFKPQSTTPFTSRVKRLVCTRSEKIGEKNNTNKKKKIQY